MASTVRIVPGGRFLARLPHIAALLVVSASVLGGCGPTLKYRLEEDSVRTVRRSKRLTVAVATVVDERPDLEADFFYREELMGAEAYAYTEDLSFGTRYLPDALTDQIVRHLDYSGVFGRVERAPFDGDLPLDELRERVGRLRGQYDLVMLAKLKHFYGYDQGGLPRQIDAHVELDDIIFVSTRSVRPVFKTDVSVKLQEHKSTREGDQYDHVVAALRRALNELVKKCSRARISRQ